MEETCLKRDERIQKNAKKEETHQEGEQIGRWQEGTDGRHVSAGKIKNKKTQKKKRSRKGRKQQNRRRMKTKYETII